MDTPALTTAPAGTAGLATIELRQEPFTDKIGMLLNMLPMLPHDVLAEYLQKRRWFASKAEILERVGIVAATPMGFQSDIVLCEIQVELAGHTEIYLLPLTIIWDDFPLSALSRDLALSRVRQTDRTGYLTDGFATEAMARGIVEELSNGTSFVSESGTLEFLGTPQLNAMALGDTTPVHWLSAEQSNSSLIMGGVTIVKLIRHIFPGVHPEVEMTRYLTGRGYRNTAPLLGEIARIAADGERHTLLIVQGAISNQGDAWTWMLKHLRATLADHNPAIANLENRTEDFTRLFNFIGNVGTRLGELHAVLAEPSKDDAFAPFPAGPAEVKDWRNGVIEQLIGAFEALACSKINLEPELAARIEKISENRDLLLTKIEELANTLLGVNMIRNHGDFHLGQLLVADLDAYIIDFEGEPSRSIAERRAKTSPLRDVAGLLRSIHYLAATAALDPGHVVEGSDGARKTLIASFADDAEKIFLSNYFAAVEGSAGLRMKPEPRDRLLDLFLLQKAAYEVEYEAGNRPNWLAIPSRGFVEVAERLLEITR